jgi:hypothetical protein
MDILNLKMSEFEDLKMNLFVPKEFGYVQYAILFPFRG